MTPTSRRPRRAAGVVAAAWVIGALVVWNGVFDSHVVAGARSYVDRQQAHLEGRGPRADMEASMSTAIADGARAATLWALLELTPGVALGWWFVGRHLRPSHGGDGRDGGSRPSARRRR